MKINENFHILMTPWRLSLLWAFMLFNMIFRDIHDLFIPAFFEEIGTGVINGNTITAEVLLVGSMMIELPVSMVILSVLLPKRYSRITNLVVAALFIPMLLMTGIRDLDDYFFIAVKVTAAIAIFYTAWRWPAASIPTTQTTATATTAAMR